MCTHRRFRGGRNARGLTRFPRDSIPLRGPFENTRATVYDVRRPYTKDNCQSKFRTAKCRSFPPSHPSIPRVFSASGNPFFWGEGVARSVYNASDRVLYRSVYTRRIGAEAFLVARFGKTRGSLAEAKRMEKKKKKKRIGKSSARRPPRARSGFRFVYTRGNELRFCVTYFVFHPCPI